MNKRGSGARLAAGRGVPASRSPRQGYFPRATGSTPLDGGVYPRTARAHGSLGYEQIAAHLNEPPDQVRNALADLRERGLVNVLSVGELERLERHITRAPSYWSLTDAGRDELARRRRATPD
jgi:hypothetical protein